MPPDDLTRIKHMLEAAEDALQFITYQSLEDFQQDRLRILAVRKCIEIIGEAAAKIPKETKEQLPDIPWQDIVGMRNILIHVYFDVDPAVLWQTIHNDLPPLIQILKSYLR